MRMLVLALAVVMAGATTARGQYGLYGSPEMVQLQAPAQAAPAPVYPVTSATPAPMYAPVATPAPVYAPVAAQAPMYAPVAQPAPMYAPAGRNMATAYRPVYQPTLQQPYPAYQSLMAPTATTVPPKAVPTPAVPTPAAAAGQAMQPTYTTPVTPQPNFPPPGMMQPGAMQQPGVIDQMLQEAPVNAPAPNASYLGQGPAGCAPANCGGNGCGYGAPARGVYRGCGQGFYTGGGCCQPQSACGYGQGACGNGQGVYRGAVEGYADACENAESCFGANNQCAWYGGVYALYMSRNKGNRVWTTYDSMNDANQVMNTDMNMRWEAGGEIRFGRRFCCGTWAIEAAYWTLGNFSGYNDYAMSTGVGTPLRVSEVECADSSGPVNGVDFFDGAQEHKLWRSSDVQNLELMVFNHPFYGGCDGCPSALQLSWGVGARYFRFDEDLRFGTLAAASWGAGSWGQYAGRYEAYMNDRIKNSLIGCQLSFTASYNVARTFRLFATPKLGVYNNHIENDFELYRGDGQDFTPTGGSGVSGRYPVHGSKDIAAFLGELDLGMEWNFAANWSATLGYRVTTVNGVGLTDSQIPYYVVDIPEIGNVKSNGTLLLHGVFAGVQYNF